MTAPVAPQVLDDLTRQAQNVLAERWPRYGPGRRVVGVTADATTVTATLTHQHHALITVSTGLPGQADPRRVADSLARRARAAATREDVRIDDAINKLIDDHDDPVRLRRWALTSDQTLRLNLIYAGSMTLEHDERLHVRRGDVVAAIARNGLAGARQAAANARTSIEFVPWVRRESGRLIAGLDVFTAADTVGYRYQHHVVELDGVTHLLTDDEIAAHRPGVLAALDASMTNPDSDSAGPYRVTVRH